MPLFPTASFHAKNAAKVVLLHFFFFWGKVAMGVDEKKSMSQLKK